MQDARLWANNNHMPCQAHSRRRLTKGKDPYESSSVVARHSCYLCLAVLVHSCKEERLGKDMSVLVVSTAQGVSSYAGLLAGRASHPAK